MTTAAETHAHAKHPAEHPAEPKGKAKTKAKADPAKPHPTLGVLPRVCKPTDRATRAMTEAEKIEDRKPDPANSTVRFKIKCLNYGGKQTEYILCLDPDVPRVSDKGKDKVADADEVMDKAEEDARECYLAFVGLDKELERLEKNRAEGSPPVEQPDLHVIRLPD